MFKRINAITLVGCGEHIVLDAGLRGPNGDVLAAIPKRILAFRLPGVRHAGVQAIDAVDDSPRPG